jgi:hypothetical protein
LNGWSVRALALGYIQVIDPEAFAACCHLNVECSTVAGAEEAEDTAKAVSVPQPRPKAVPAAVAHVLPASAIVRPGARLHALIAAAAGHSTGVDGRT